MKSWLHQDHLGSVRVATDTSGAVTARYQYTPYGVMSGTSTNGRGFGGHVTDTTGFIYMNARYYDPTIGRFLSADTAIPNLADPQALNRYTYVYNNPVVNTDPTGHVPVVAAFVVALAEGTALAWVAFAVTTVGYLTHDAFLMSVGAIMGGYVADGVWGAVVAGMASPVSPLDPKVKEAIGWAYTAYGLMQSYKAYELEHMTPAEKLQAEWRDYEQRLHAIEPSKPILVASADKAQVVEIIGARLAQPPAPAAGAPMATVSTGVMLVYAQAQVEVPLVTNSKFTYNAGKVCTLGGTCRSYTSQGGGIGGPSASVNAGVFFADSIESFGGDFNNFSVGGKGMWGADVMWDPSNPAHFGGGVSWGWSGKSVSPVSVTKTTTTLAPKGR